nr:SMC-Scp complex subunit ScpB [Actinoplanes polyasparticus]
MGAPEDTESIAESGLSDDDDDFDPAFEGADPAVATTDDAAGVDAEVGLDESVSEVEPVDVRPGPELPLPESIEQAAAAADEDEPGTPVDAPLPPEGDDAGDVFDAAADDDVSDDGEMDLPFADEVPVSTSEDDPEDDVVFDAEDDFDDDERDDSPEEPAVAAAEPAVADAAVPGQKRRAAKTDGTIDEAGLRTAEMDLPGLTDDAELAAALEAIMLVVDEPVAELQLAQILEQPTERIALMLDNLSARYTAAGHGFDLRRVAGGWRLYTRPEYAAYVERFVLDGQSVRLTQAALETLAVVAYKQPVTRSRISAIRGVNCDGVMRTLVTRGLIEECGTESETGAHLYRTTGLFLEKLGLNSVDQLPPLAPFLPDDVEEVLDATG